MDISLKTLGLKKKKAKTTKQKTQPLDSELGKASISEENSGYN